MYIFITGLVNAVGEGDDLRSPLSPRRHVYDLRRLSSVAFSLFCQTTFCVLQRFFSFNSPTLCRWWMFHFEPACCQIACHHRWWVTAQPTSCGNLATIPNPFHFPSFHDIQHTQTLGVIKGLKMRERENEENMKKCERLQIILAAVRF
jgi:hypothetical protein